MRGDLDDRVDGRLRQQRPAEVGVQDRAGGVHDAHEAGWPVAGSMRRSTLVRIESSSRSCALATSRPRAICAPQSSSDLAAHVATTYRG